MFLSVTIFGTFQAKIDDIPVTTFRSNKARALLVYLMCMSHRAHPREALAHLFWPNQGAKQASANLRQTLTRLQKAIQNSTASPPFLLLERETIQFNRSSQYSLDGHQFQKLLAACTQHHIHYDPYCQVCMHNLKKAATLYQDDCLPHFFVRDAPEFEHWLQMLRQELHQKGMLLLQRVATFHEQRGEYEEAKKYAQRQINLEPWSEKGHRQLIRLLAYQGQRSAALAQYQVCRTQLETELGVTPSPETESLIKRIKNAAEKRPHHLPSTPNAFIGREEELAQINQYITDSEKRLLTVVGLGGIGKTRLTLEAAHRVAAQYSGPFIDGLFWVSLLGIQSTNELITAVANAVGVDFSGSGNIKFQIIHWLREKELLLILDNIEHLIDLAAPIINQILQETSAVQFVTTSRERLNLPQEWVLSIDGLPYLPTNILTSRQMLQASSATMPPAMKLFVARASQLNATFQQQLNQQEIDAIAAICEFVEGMPLGIELATAWVNTLSCHELAQQIKLTDQALDLFMTSQRQALARHRSIRVLFEYSWQMLTADEKKACATLSVFQGGCTLDAVSTILDRSGPITIQRILSTLINKSLLHRLDGDRFRQHELLRQFAAEKLAADARQKDAIHLAHATYYGSLLQQLEMYWEDERVQTAVSQIDANVQNIRAGWQWGIRQQQLPVIAPYIISLYDYYAIKNLYQEGVTAFDDAVTNLSGQIGANVPVTNHAHQLAKLITRKADFQYRLGQPHHAIETISISLPLLSETDTEELAFTYKLLGTIHHHLGAFSKAQHYLEKSFANISSETIPSLRAHTCLLLAEVTGARGDYMQAQKWLHLSLSLYTDMAQMWGIAHATRLLGEMTERLGNKADALAHYQEGLYLFKELESPHGIALCLTRIGQLLYEGGQVTEAKQQFKQSLKISQKHQLQTISAQTLTQLALISAEESDYQFAQAHLQTALATAIDIQAMPIALETLYHVANLQLNEQRLPDRISLKAIKKTYQLLNLVAQHAASTQETRQLALETISHLTESLPATLRESLTTDRDQVELQTAVTTLLTAKSSNHINQSHRRA